MYNDYFDLPAPSTGDLVFEELKRILMGTLKEEIKTELEALRKENEELRPFKLERDRMEQELARVRADCVRKIKEAQENARNSTFESLLGEHMVQAWKVGREYELPPKCDKCDDQRKLHFTSPRGKNMTEPCECSQSTTIYKPVPALLARFRVKPLARAKNQENDDSFYEKPLYYWYTTEYSTLDNAEFILSEETEIGALRHSDTKPLNELSEWHSVFTSEERCQEFCDYLAEQDKNKAW
jgi:hypothetical protein